MSAQPEKVNPADLAGINARALAWAGDPAAVRPVAIDRVTIAEDAIADLVDVVRAYSAGGKALLVMDRTPMRRGSDDLKALVADALAAAVPLTVRLLPEDPGEVFHADLDTARVLAREAAAHAVVVSVGSGSVTDVAKYARHLVSEDEDRMVSAPSSAGDGAPPLGARPRANSPRFVCFPTAASVTAYTSALAVLQVDGVKRTLASRPPDAVVCDLRSLAGAPAAMTQAGFGDVVARSVAYGDWFLANELGMDDGFSSVPSKLLEAAEQAMLEGAETVADGSTGGVRLVSDAVLLAGMAMSLVNQTAPVSGWEHVISHFLDLTAAGDGREQALHGAQVGVATLISARAYERFWADLDLEAIRQPIDEAAHIRAARAAFGAYDPSGKMLAEIERDLKKKRDRWNAATAARQRFIEAKRAGAFDAFLAANVRSSVDIAAALSRAGAPLRFDALEPVIPAATALAAVRSSHLIRARFTLGDLLDLTGRLSESHASSLLLAG